MEILNIETIRQAMKCLTPPETVNHGHFNFRSSPLFPFEIMYDACDIETKQQIKIPSGEICHGVLIDNNGTASTTFIEQLIKFNSSNEV